MRPSALNCGLLISIFDFLLEASVLREKTRILNIKGRNDEGFADDLAESHSGFGNEQGKLK
jgi:hypothetical protein